MRKKGQVLRVKVIKNWIATPTECRLAMTIRLLCRALYNSRDFCANFNIIGDDSIYFDFLDSVLRRNDGVVGDYHEKSNTVEIWFYRDV